MYMYYHLRFPIQLHCIARDIFWGLILCRCTVHSAQVSIIRRLGRNNPLQPHNVMYCVSEPARCCGQSREGSFTALLCHSTYYIASDHHCPLLRHCLPRPLLTYWPISRPISSAGYFPIVIAVYIGFAPVYAVNKIGCMSYLTTQLKHNIGHSSINL